MKSHTLTRVAAAVAVGLLSSSAFAATMMGNNSNKGSLLIFPRIDVRAGVDTFITLVNDASVPVTVKCYYRSSEPVPTPLSTSFNTAFIKHTMDFSFNLTHNQPVTWSAATGLTTDGAQLAQAFTLWPDGAARQTGELKCWALGVDNAGNVTQINFNQLFGNAAIVGAPFGAAGQAYEYNAWAFQALGGTSAQGQAVGPTPGTLPLDGTINGYDLCPNILLADFQPNGGPALPIIGAAGGAAGASGTQVSIAACNQDLTQRARPFITKYTYTFWNEDEFARTGTHECGDSYYETNLPATGGTGAAPNPGPFLGFPLAQYGSLGTATAYMRVESVADTFVCANAVQFGMVGVIAHANSAGTFVRGSNMIGRGTRAGSMTYDVGPADSFKK